MSDIEYDPDGAFASLFGGQPLYDVKTQWCEYCGDAFTLRCTVEETDGRTVITTLDSEPLYAHLRAKHLGVVPLATTGQPIPRAYAYETRSKS